MNNKQNSKLPPFHPFFQRSWNAQAWLKLNPWSRLVYILLVSQYRPSLNNNGQLFLSTRRAAEKLGCSKSHVATAFKELAFYGFIVMTNPGWLGVEGKGKSPRWRSTELPCGDDPPTYDFERWNGELFGEQKSPGYYKRRERRLAQLAAARAAKKQNPVQNVRTLCPKASKTSGH
jgi:Helix-turn-helix domain